MKLAFNTWVYSGFPVWVPSYPLEEVIKRLARIGYDGIEIGAAAPHAFPDYLSAERRREIRRVLDGEGINVSSMLPAPGGGAGYNVASPDAPERAAAIDMYKKVTDLCAEWGSPTLLYVAGWQVFGTSRPQAFEWTTAALAEIADQAAASGVTVAVEPTSADSNLIDSCDDVIGDYLGLDLQPALRAAELRPRHGGARQLRRCLARGREHCAGVAQRGRRLDLFRLLRGDLPWRHPVDRPLAL